METTRRRARSLLERMRQTPMRRGAISPGRQQLKEKIAGGIAAQAVPPVLAKRIAFQVVFKFDESELNDSALWTAIGGLLRQEIAQLKTRAGLADRQIAMVLPKLSAGQVEAFLEELTTTDRRIARTILNAALEAADPLSAGRRFLTGHWIWGGGWLATAGFWDFAGSTVVHSVGGWAALAGIMVLGPRLGKYGPDGRVNAIPPHSYTSAVIGCFVLWLGWFGFNPGSTMAVDAFAISHIFMTTNTAGVMALLSATALSWIWDGKPSLGMSVNGCLAGLVAITAGCAFVTVNVALLIGLLAGIIVVCAVKLCDTLEIDDPVGAVPVHLFNGVFGTLCVGLFAVDKLTGSATGNGLFNGGGMTLLIAQLKGIGAVAVYTLAVSLVFWLMVKMAMGLRVSRQEEEEGLDIGEHGEVAYIFKETHPIAQVARAS